MRSIRLTLLTAAAIFCAAGCTSTDTGVVSRATYQDPNDPDPVICRKVVHVGSRLPSRDCRHESTWAAEAAAGRAFTESIQRGGAIQTGDN
jgi:hypothetical protein